MKRKTSGTGTIFGRMSLKKLKKQFEEVDIEAEIYGRPKHIYSIYRKMVLQNKQFNEIYDLLAVRIIVNSIKDCYAVSRNHSYLLETDAWTF